MLATTSQETYTIAGDDLPTEQLFAEVLIYLGKDLWTKLAAGESLLLKEPTVVTARKSLLSLTTPTFERLLRDVADEIDRRESELALTQSALPTDPGLSPARNDYRKNLAAFTPYQLKSTAITIALEAQRRWPTLASLVVFKDNTSKPARPRRKATEDAAGAVASVDALVSQSTGQAQNGVAPLV